ncbi:quinone oxidoreductase family protein [Sanguibacter suaedae]|uniref:Quinone oxidoreductase n=1 Tax=Sanguibacter suaedae TaxID=2795737 RepID=A0A934MA64_9MICO|nr:quinone oxidoreductase [Sanguibacter suaedae]MBI9115423.1 quinone oxidoreductase [Sanguibacter suaedae]
MTTGTTTVVATAPGGPEVLAVRTVPALRPGPGEVVVDVAAAGVNFIDTYRRSGVYPMTYPGVLGSEGAGTVTAVGDGVETVRPGDRVAWCDAPDSYASQVLLPAERAVPVPDDVDLLTAAALPLQGLTAHYLVTSTFAVGPGQDVLVHAGAGGVGLLLTQLAVRRGARVITTVSTSDKADLSRAAGAHDVVLYTELDDLTRDLPAVVRGLTDDRGVHVAYDSVGKDTFDASLASVRTRGTLVLFGGSSGQVPPFDLQRLNAAGSLAVARPSLAHHVATREELLSRSDDLFRAVSDGTLHVRVGATYPLADAARAHEALESRRTTGKVLLVP